MSRTQEPELWTRCEVAQDEPPALGAAVRLQLLRIAQDEPPPGPRAVNLPCEVAQDELPLPGRRAGLPRWTNFVVWTATFALYGRPMSLGAAAMNTAGVTSARQIIHSCRDGALWTDSELQTCEDYYVFQYCNGTGGYGSGGYIRAGVPFEDYANADGGTWVRGVLCLRRRAAPLAPPSTVTFTAPASAAVPPVPTSTSHSSA
ncbi:hypothetical protein CYMTET_20714, partial [Cymbomonas tetramitiformis]